MEGAKVVSDKNGGVLFTSGTGHAFWLAAPRSDSFTLRFRYKHGSSGTGEVVLQNSGEPPRHQEYRIRFSDEQVTMQETVVLDRADPERPFGSVPCPAFVPSPAALALPCRRLHHLHHSTRPPRRADK